MSNNFSIFNIDPENIKLNKDIYRNSYHEYNFLDHLENKNITIYYPINPS